MTKASKSLQNSTLLSMLRVVIIYLWSRCLAGMMEAILKTRIFLG